MRCLADYLSIVPGVLPGRKRKINSGLASQMYYKEFNKQNRNYRVIYTLLQFPQKSKQNTLILQIGFKASNLCICKKNF